MRAAVVTSPGGPDAIEIATVAVPEPARGEVRIRVEAAGVNPVDVQTREGAYHTLGWITESRVGLGWDVAGLIDAIGEDVEGFTLGMPVAALFAGVDKPLGTYAEHVVLPAQAVARRPAGLAAAEAATVPLNALTASQALDLLGPAAGRSLLVTGAAGAVGGYALRLAARRGFTVTGLAREGDRVFVERSGATLITATPRSAAYDTVLDAAVLGESILAAIHDGGAYVGVVPPAVPDSVRGIATTAVLARADGQRLADLLDRTASGELPARVREILSLAEAGRAHAQATRKGVRGRVVLVP